VLALLLFDPLVDCAWAGVSAGQVGLLRPLLCCCCCWWCCVALLLCLALLPASAAAAA
jgi:hypothetical protein